MPRLAYIAVALCTAAVVMLNPSPRSLVAVREQARVRAHLDSAEREVRAGPTGGLSVSQRAARARALDRLHEYWVRGVFPRNTDFPGQLVPYFIDRSGTRCAMAHLIEQAGAADFVARVAETHNNARIRDLKDDPELIAWLAENGLTAAEAARIQPAYCNLPPEQQLIPCDPWIDVSSGRASTGYKTSTGVLVGADVLAVALHSLRTGIPRQATGVASVATGLLGIIAGMPNLDETGSRRTLGYVNAGAGAVSAAFGVYTLTRKPAMAARLSVAPLFGTGGVEGLAAQVRF